MAAATAGRFAPFGGKVTTHVVSVTDPVDVNATADAVIAAHGKVTILISSAGIARLHSALDFSNEEWRLVMDVNVTARCAPSAATWWSGEGCIVNLGSMSGLSPQFTASYVASKGAEHMLTRALAIECVDSSVRVNAVAPAISARK
nr:SDR family oxidoreductase [Rhizobium rhizolycopersici]